MMSSPSDTCIKPDYLSHASITVNSLTRSEYEPAEIAHCLVVSYHNVVCVTQGVVIVTCI